MIRTKAEPATTMATTAPRMTVEQLEEYFKTAKLPETMTLDKATEVMNPTKMVEGHLHLLKSNPDKAIYESFHRRLQLVYDKLQGI